MYKHIGINLILCLGLAAGSSAFAEIVRVEARTDADVVKLGGTVVPYKEVSLTAQMPGRIEFIAGKEGDSFEEGVLLVKISDEDLLAKKKQVQAEYERSLANLQNSQVQYNRELWSPQTDNINRMPGMGMPAMFDNMFTKSMGDSFGSKYDSDIQRQADLYHSGSQVNQAQSAVRQATSALEEIDAKIRDTRSISPFKGTIIAKLIEEGDTVQPGMPLLKYANTEYIRIQTEVPVRLVPFLKVGDTVRAHLDVTGRFVPAKVAIIYPLADNTKHTVTVKFDLPIGTRGVPGMYAEVDIPVKTGSETVSIAIPVTSILRDKGSLPSVWVVNDNNCLELHVVRLGKQVDAKYRTVLSGLKVGDRIIDQPSPQLAPGCPTENTDL